MSESVTITTELYPLSSIIMRIVANHVRDVKAITTTSINSLDYATLRCSYENVFNLAQVLHSSENLTNRFATLVTKNEDLLLERDATMADHNILTTWVTQLEAQLTQTLALMTATTNSSSADHKGQTDPEKFTGEDCGNINRGLSDD
jgi:hypothetical protein